MICGLEEVGELLAVLDLLSACLGMLEEASAKKDERIRELELQVEHLNDQDAKVTVSPLQVQLLPYQAQHLS